MRKLLFVVALVLMPLFAYNVSVVSQVVSNNCPIGWEAIASLNGTSNSHIAEPGDSDYTYKLCVKGEFISSGGYNAKSSLTTSQSVLVGLFRNVNSHAEAPNETSYTNAAYASCPVDALIKTNCGAEENCIIEFYNFEGNTHVAQCGTGLTYKLCVKAKEPDVDEYACSCNYPSSDWNSDYFVGTLGTCCGDDLGEKETSASLDGSCIATATSICCEDNKCGRDNGGTPSCDPVGSACGSYLCSESTWQECSVGESSYCTNVDLDNDGLYDQFCNNDTGTWELAASMSDFCQNSCEQLNGIWTGQGTLPSEAKNCCSSADSGSTWCIDTSNRVTRCSSGKPIDCAVYCDTQGSINDDGNVYTCTGASDLDCKSSGCSGTDCDCGKGEGTGCFVSSACVDGGCETYRVSTGNSTYFSNVDNKTGFAGICCPTDACTFDSDQDGKIDACAQDGTSSIDSDNDGDIDYCNAGEWQECGVYSCSTAGSCSCMGDSTNVGTCDYVTETAGIYSTGTGLCYIQNSGLDCALPCDSDGDLGTREYINNDGFCVKGGGSCQDIYRGISWFGNSSLSFVNTSLSCLCDTQAYCTVDVHNSTGLAYTTSKTVSATGSWDLIPLTDPFDKGQNSINITCGCGSGGAVPPTSCDSNVTTINYDSTSSVNVGNLLVGNPETVDITVNNIGSVDLSGFVIGATITSGGISITNFTTQKYLAAGASLVVPVLFDIPITMYNDTKLTGSNETSVLLFSNVTDVLLLHTQDEVSYTYQCAATSDCKTSCPLDSPNCWAYGGYDSNFTCSAGVCCPLDDHFEDGACCTSGYRCCIEDNTCTTEEWCANATTYDNYGIIWSCNDIKLDGQTCLESRMCDSGNCETAGLGGEEYCCQAVLTVTEAGGECSTLAGGEVCSSTGCCTDDTECGSGTWCTLYGNRCVDCPTSTDAGYFNGYCSSDQCIGSDADCCSVPSDCDTAESISGDSYYCNTEVSTCETCTSSLDYYCPSFDKCYIAGPGEGDPDCCSTDSDCFSGNTCTDNTCVPENIGKFCSDDAECGDGLNCVGGSCILEDFLIVNPTSVDMNVGEVRYATIIVRDPQLKSDTYTLSLSGDQLQFAKIDSGTSMRINIGPNEVKKFNMVLFGGAAVSGGQLKVFASSETVAGISSEKSITLNINQVAGSGVVAAAPGITFSESLAILVIGGVLAWSLKKL
ncbi:MAG: hypothetical protein GOU98_03225 [Candidatus Altiarchaeota archaeon]|nr:hypothetical protein [Candidatus Altiarchaeota archaeon]